MGIYGNLLNAFPELVRTIEVWTKQDMSDTHKIRAVFMPTRGDRLMRQKYTNRGSAIQYFEDDHLFVSAYWRDNVHIGDFFREPDEQHIHRIVGMLDLKFQGGYTAFITERVTGANCEQTDSLEIKEPSFA